MDLLVMKLIKTQEYKLHFLLQVESLTAWNQTAIPEPQLMFHHLICI